MSTNLKSVFNTGSQNIAEWTKQDYKLWEGVLKGSSSLVQNLLHRGVDPTKLRKDRGISSFHNTVMTNNFSMLKLIITHSYSLDINAKDSKGRTALQLAICKAQEDMVKFLIENDADLTTMDVEEKTLMHSAVLGGHIGCVQILLMKRAPNDWPDKAGYTPLHYAVEKNQATNASILLKDAASVNKKDALGNTAIMYSAKNGNAGMCSLLLERGADKNIVDNEGHTALWQAEKLQCIPVMKILNANNDTKSLTKEINGGRSEESFPDRLSSQAPLGREDELTNQIEEISKSTSNAEYFVEKKNPENVQKSLEMVQEQIKKLSEEEPLDENQNAQVDPFNRKFAQSYRKLKEQVEFKDSDDLVTCISESLTHILHLTARNEDLQKELTEFERERKDYESNLKVAESRMYTLVVQKDVLYEENQHLKKILLEAIPDQKVLQEVEDNFYDHDLIRAGNKQSVEFNALKSHIKSYTDLENQYKESLVSIDTLKRRLEENNIEVDALENDLSNNSANEEWQRLMNSYYNKTLESFHTLLDSYESLIQENDVLKMSFKTINLASNLPEPSANNNFIYDTIKQDSEFQTSDYPPSHFNTATTTEENVYLQQNNLKQVNKNIGEVEIQRDILLKEVESLKRIINSLNNGTMNKVANESDQSANVDMKDKSEVFVAEEKVKNNQEMLSKPNLEGVERELEELRKEVNEDKKNNQELLRMLQDHYIEYFTDPNSSELPKVSSNLRTMVKQLTVSNASLMEAMQEQHKTFTELKEQMNIKNQKIVTQQKTLDSFGNMAVEKDILEKKVENLKFIIDQNNLSNRKKKSSTEISESQKDIGNTAAFIDEFILENALLFKNEKTKQPIESCFDQIFKLETIKNNLIDQKATLLWHNKACYEEINKLKQDNERLKNSQQNNSFFQNDNRKNSMTPTITLNNEEDVFSEDLLSMDELGELFVKKNVLEREIEILENLDYLNKDDKEKQRNELNRQLNEINYLIQQINGYLDIRDEEKQEISLIINSRKSSYQSSTELPNFTVESEMPSPNHSEIKKMDKSSDLPFNNSPSESIVHETDAALNQIDLKNKDTALIYHLQEHNNFLRTQIEDLNILLLNEEEMKKENGKEEKIANKNTDFSTFYTTSPLNKEKIQNKRNKKTINESQNYLEKLKNENNRLNQQLSQAHGQVRQVFENLKTKTENKIPGETYHSNYSDNEATHNSLNVANSEDFLEFVRNLEKLNEQQKKSLDDKEKEIQELNDLPDEYQKLFLKYNNLLQNCESLKNSKEKSHSLSNLKPQQDNITDKQNELILKSQPTIDNIDNLSELCPYCNTEQNNKSSKLESKSPIKQILDLGRKENVNHLEPGTEKEKMESQYKENPVNENSSKFKVDLEELKVKYLDTIDENEKLKLGIEELNDKISNIYFKENKESNLLRDENKELKKKLSDLDSFSQNQVMDLKKEIKNLKVKINEDYQNDVAARIVEDRIPHNQAIFQLKKDLEEMEFKYLKKVEENEELKSLIEELKKQMSIIDLNENKTDQIVKKYNKELNRNIHDLNQNDSLSEKQTNNNLENKEIKYPETNGKERNSSQTEIGVGRQVSSISIECERTVPICVCEASELPLNEYLLSHNYVCELRMEIDRLQKELLKMTENNFNLNKQLQRLNDNYEFSNSQNEDYKLKENILLKNEIAKLRKIIDDNSDKKQEKEFKNNAKINENVESKRSHLNASNLNDYINKEEFEGEINLNKLIEVQSKEISRLQDSLKSTQAELDSYRAEHLGSRNGRKGNGRYPEMIHATVTDIDEMVTLRQLNSQLTYEVTELKYNLRELRKFKRPAISYEEIGGRKLLDSKRKEHKEKMSECEDKIHEYEAEIIMLKNQNRTLKMDKDNLTKNLEIYRNARRAHCTPNDILTQNMKRENVKLQHFLDILSSAQPLKSPGLRKTEASEDNAEAGQSRKHLHEIGRLNNILMENELAHKEKISTYQKHLLSSFQGTLPADVKEKLRGIVEEELKKRHYASNENELKT